VNKLSSSHEEDRVGVIPKYQMRKLRLRQVERLDLRSCSWSEAEPLWTFESKSSQKLFVSCDFSERF